MTEPTGLLGRRVPLLAGCVLAGLFFILLVPSAGVPAAFVDLISGGLHREGAPDWLSSPVLWERALNVVLFVPVGAVLALLLPRWPVLAVAALGAAASLAFESVQAYLLPGRDGSWWDVGTNSVGALLGAVLVAVVLRRARGGRAGAPRGAASG